MIRKVDTRTTCYIENFDSNFLTVINSKDIHEVSYDYGRIRIIFENEGELIKFVRKLTEEVKIKNEDNGFDMIREKQDYIDEVKLAGGKVE